MTFSSFNEGASRITSPKNEQHKSFYNTYEKIN